VGDDKAEVPLRVWGSAERPSKARRRAGVVYREAGPWSLAVLALLRHLEREGFAGAPRVVGSGFAEDGREMVGYVPGASPHPRAWAEDAVAGVGRLLRDLHAAAASFEPPPGALWRPWFGRELAGSRPVFRSASWMLTNRPALRRAIG
jgi:Ser/Thr protein kinase RdoA (MazF antagonist)